VLKIMAHKLQPPNTSAANSRYRKPTFLPELLLVLPLPRSALPWSNTLVVADTF